MVKPISQNLETEFIILEAARKIFMKKGMHGARMQEIADEAGINKALLHYYYRNKEQLFMKIFKETFYKFFPEVLVVLDSEVSFESKIKLFVRAYIDMLIDNPFIPVFIINEIHNKPEILSDMTGKMSKLTESKFFVQLNEKINSGKIKPIKPIHLLINMLSLSVFPFVASPMIRGVFSMTDADMKNFYEERKELIPALIINSLKN
ncbi:MAG: TetR/AcrR family transcriptional regulator [Cyclobacteriaceae bacterium]|nr:TetR/AcrR family transcriptional regulator [Cyclobacteriaceae bacterium]